MVDHFILEGSGALARAAGMSGVVLEVGGKPKAWWFIPQCSCAFTTLVVASGVVPPWSYPLTNAG